MVAGPEGFNLGTAVAYITLDSSGIGKGIADAKRALEEGTKGIGAGLQNIGQQLSQVGGSLTVLTSPLLVFGATGLKVAADFDSAMQSISARTGLVGESLEEIRQLALRMGAQTQFSALDSARAFEQLLSSGQSAAEAIATLPAILTASSAAGADLGQTADTVTDIMALFNLQASDAGMIVDAMARASGASSAEMGDLGQAFRGVGTIARRFGIDVNQTAAILGVFAEAGQKGSQAGQLLESMLTNMSRNTDPVNAAWAELGTSMYDVAGNARPIVDVINDIKRAFVNMNPEQQNRIIQTLAGSYGQAGLSALLGSISIEDMTGRMANSADAATMAAAKMNTFAGRMESLSGSIETLQIQALTPLMNDVLAPLVEQITRIVNSVTDWIVANPALAAQLARVAAIIAVIGPTLLIAGKALAAIGGIITFFTTTTLGPLIAVLGGLYLAFESNFLGIRDVVQPILDNISDGIGTLFGVLGRFGDIVQESGIGTAIASVINAFMQMAGIVGNEEMSDAALQMGDGIVTAFLTVKNAIETQVIPAIQNFIGIIGRIWADVSPFLTQLANWFLFDALPAIARFLTDVVIPIVQDVIGWLGEIWTAVSPYLQQLWDWFITTGLPAIIFYLETVVGPAINDFITILKNIWDVVSPVISKLVEWFTQTALPGIVSFIKNTITPAINDFIDILKNIWTAVEPGITALKDGIQRAFTWIKENIVDPLITRFEEFKTTLKTLADGLGAYGGAGANLSTAVDMVTSGQVAPIDFINALLGAINSEIGGSFASGIQYLPNNMLAMLHKGEAVIPADVNAARLSGGSWGSGSGADESIHIENMHIHANTPEQARTMGDQVWEQIRFARRSRG